MGGGNSRWPKRVGIGLLLNIGIGMIFLGAAVFLVNYLNVHMRQLALKEAEKKAEIILERSLAIHTYFSHVLKPSVVPLVGATHGQDFFDPRWMSSTYAVRGIDAYFQEMSKEGYYYKECAINARSPENEADAFERAFIEELNANPELKFRSQVRSLNGTLYFVTLRRGEVMEEACLRCHTTPDLAPQGLVAAYGGTRSFNRKSGEVVSAVSIRVPLADAYADADHTSKVLAVMFVTILLVIFGVQFLFYEVVVSRPLRMIHDQALRVSQDRASLGEDIPLPAGRELYQLSAIFNQMSGRLKHHIERLTASEEKFRTLFEHMVQGVFYQDADGRLTDANQSALAMLGWGAEGMAGDGSYHGNRLVVAESGDELPPDQHPSAVALRTGQPVLDRVIGIYDPARQDYNWFSVNAIPQFKAGEATPYQVFVTLHDITELKLAEEKLQKAHDQLEDRVRARTRELEKTHGQLLHAEKFSAMGRLSASIAHEFNNPLQGVLTVLKGLKRRATVLEEEDAKLVDMAVSECHRMRDLIKSLNDFYRPTSGRQEPVDIHAAIDSLLLLSSKDFRKRQISVRKEYAVGLPRVRVVADQVKQVFLNLLNNAADACEGGGSLITVATDVLEKEKKIVVRVQDSGKGIRPQDMLHIFEPFFTTKPEVKGTGLGLTVSYSIMRGLGGGLRVESVLDKGTTFTVIFPYEETDDEE